MTLVSRSGPPPAALPAEAWVTALSALDLMGPARLSALLAESPPAAAWARVAAGDLRATATDRLRAALRPQGEAVVARWRRQAVALDVGALWRRHVDAGVGVAIRSSASYPTPFLDDPDPPAVVFLSGDPDAVIGVRVGIIGTRDCTRYGYDIARSLGAALSEAGVSVVSGLALGIDGAAHTGALEAGGAPPVAVVGSGLDRPYPTRNGRLWARVASAGVVMSEYPLGTPPIGWHFPARNRLIAALADVLVVVESQEAGGSMLTVEHAAQRGRDVLAVPGPITARTSAGTNKLLAEGRGVVRDVTDVLVALGMTPAVRRSARERRPAPAPADQGVLDLFDWQPVTIDSLVLRSGLGLGDLVLALDRLVAAGWVDQRGGWFERVAKAGG